MEMYQFKWRMDARETSLLFFLFLFVLNESGADLMLVVSNDELSYVLII